MSGYVKTFKVKDGYENKNNKLMSRINDKKLLQKYNIIWTKKTSKILIWMRYQSMIKDI